MNQEDIARKIDELEERIELQILTLQIIREHLVELHKRVERLKEDLV
jgi:uncharacterized coiled-coil protein SlyX